MRAKYALAAAAVALLGVSSAQAALVYTESFSEGTNPPPNQPLADAGWTIDTLETGKARRYDDAGNVRVFSFAGVGREEAIYSSTTLDTGLTGTAFPSIDPTNPATNVVTFGADIQGGFNLANVSARWLVQVGETNPTWYASATVISTNSTSFQPFSLVYNPTAGEWRGTSGITGTGVGNSNPVLGEATTADLSGMITGAGLLFERQGSNNGTYNFDNFTVDVVPEPSSIALLGLLAPVLLRRRRV